MRGSNAHHITVDATGHRIDSHADRSKSGSSAASSTQSCEYRPLSYIVQCRVDCFERPPLFDSFERPELLNFEHAFELAFVNFSLPALAHAAKFAHQATAEGLHLIAESGGRGT